MDADVLIIGSGVAGLSLAAALVPKRKVLVLEAEDAVGYHSSGRSAAFSHFGIGNHIVRTLTAASRSYFQEEKAGETPLARFAPALFVATTDMEPALAELGTIMSAHTSEVRTCGEAEMRSLFPPLRIGPDAITGALLDPHGMRLDSAALLQFYARQVNKNGQVLTGQRIEFIDATSAGWEVRTTSGRRTAEILANAGGAWADRLAQLAGVAPLGLTPLRRTVIVVDPPEGADVRDWAFVKTAVDDFYILPEGGRLMASPVDEVPTDPCDAQPEDYDMALAAAKVEHYTTLPVRRIAHRWAGLRTFAADRSPVVGFDPRMPNFFWCAGQGGFGLQTAPALSAAAASLLLGEEWPQPLAAQGVHPHELTPERLIHA